MIMANLWDVSREAGILWFAYGPWLGRHSGDVNETICLIFMFQMNFFERDYLYINQGTVPFLKIAKNGWDIMSLASMGADLGDINNDGHPEIFTSEG